MPTRRELLAGAGAAACMTFASGQPAASAPAVRLGVLKFGTVAWELETLSREGFDIDAGVRLAVTELAGNQAAQVALQAGAVDVIVSDWLWVAERRRTGEDFVFAPFSCAVGALVTGGGSAVNHLADLRGKRLGVAGTPIDKSWLLLKAYARETAGLDVAGETSPAFAAPALLNEKLASNEFDAVLNFWHFAARAEARGARRILDVQTMVNHYAGVTGVPAVGYVFRQSWADANPAAAFGFYAATLRAKAFMAENDAAWERLRPIMRAEDDATFRLLRDRYREGRPTRWGDAERAGAARIYRLLSKDGATDPPPGMFWNGAAF